MKKRNGTSKHKGGKGKRRNQHPSPLSTAPTVQRRLAATTSDHASKNRRRAIVSATQVVPARYSQDERLSLALLLAPFLILAVSLASQQILRSPSLTFERPSSMASADPRPVDVARDTAPPGPSATALVETAFAPAPFPAASGGATARLPIAVKRAPLPRLATIIKPEALPADRPRKQLVRQAPLPGLRPLLQREDLAASAPRTETAALDPSRVPPMALPPAVAEKELEPRTASAVMPPPGLDPPAIAPQAQCHAKPDLMSRARAQLALAQANGHDRQNFGRALAHAAMAQLDDVVIYNARYTRLPFPNGDVSPLYGVCTDVIVRAYRALDIDLQQLVQATKTGRGDPNIDHRRVEVLRKFLEKHGEVLPITDLAEDYLPGDIVTYYRPQNRTTTGHVGLVTDVLAPSGRLMILHNRGWGPQLEDALFVDKITGHYRFAGLPANEGPAASPGGTVQRRIADVDRPARVQIAGKLAAARNRTSSQAKP